MFYKRLMDPMEQGLRRQLQMRRIQHLTKYNQMGSFSRTDSDKGDLKKPLGLESTKLDLKQLLKKIHPIRSRNVGLVT